MEVEKVGVTQLLLINQVSHQIKVEGIVKNEGLTVIFWGVLSQQFHHKGMTVIVQVDEKNEFEAIEIVFQIKFAPENQEIE